MSTTADTRPPPTEQISFSAWKTLLLLAGTIVMFLFLNTAMAPAIPYITEDFQTSQSLTSWVMTAYMVTGAVMTVIMGRLADSCWSQENANDYDGMFYCRNYLGTIC